VVRNPASSLFPHREKMQSLAQSAGILPQTTGDNNKQVAVKDSQDVKISIR
jgi:hypothetical protein